MELKNYNGILNNLLSKNYISKYNKKKILIPINEILIVKNILEHKILSLDKLDKNSSICIISSKNSFKALGDKVCQLLNNYKLEYKNIILENYKSDIFFGDMIYEKIKDHSQIICVGSGSLIDICKYASNKAKNELIIFCSSLSAAATTNSVSLTNNGIKTSIKSKIPETIIIDLDNLKKTPMKLIRSSLGDVLCRTTCQVDWLMSSLLTNTSYDETPFELQYNDEEELLQNSKLLETGDINLLASLSRMTLLNGIAAIIIGSTHAGSMGEHMISHYIDMFMQKNNLKTLHGEQVGVTTIKMSEIQNYFINSDTPFQLKKLKIEKDLFLKKFSNKYVDSFYESYNKKKLNHDKIKHINKILINKWDEIKFKLNKHSIKTKQIKNSLTNIQGYTSNTDLNISDDFYNRALKDSFLTRDRFSFLDIMNHTNTFEYFKVTNQI